METFKWEKDMDKRRKETLEKHERLHRLFIEDQPAFEREGKTTIDSFINGIEDEDRRRKLRNLQNSWDKKMKHAGSTHNRLVLAQTIFWNHFSKNWLPAIKNLDLVLKDKSENI